MKAEDLMTGDWVWYDNKQVQILQLSKDGKYRNITPIPLTSEILEKNGFVKLLSQYVLEADKEPFIHLISLDNMPNANGSMLVAIKDRYTNAKIAITYVHELQHALRLCGIEKEVIL